jgi:DegV family protein with EDD domain
MQIVTNYGSNLSGAIVQHYGIHLTPQRIIVDGTTHDTNDRTPLSQIDEWVRNSNTHPHVVGTTAHEFVAFFSGILKHDPECLAVMTSRKLVQSHLACVTAARTLSASASSKHAKIAVIDSRMTDVGPGLLSIVAGEAAKARLPFALTVNVLETLRERAHFAFTLESLDYLVKGGRASWLKAQIATFLQVRPLIALVDGETKSVGRLSRNADPVAALVGYMVERFGRGRAMWLGIFHGDVPEKAGELLREVRKAFDVRFAYVRAAAMTTYLHAGAGALGLALLPMDDLAWTPPTPPDFGNV